MEVYLHEARESALREQLLQAMRGDQAHLDFEASLSGLTFESASIKVPGAPHTAWQLIEHLRIAQEDILEFSRDPKHKSPKWPGEYWPASEGPHDEPAWAASLAAFRESAEAMNKLISDLAHDLFKPIEGGDGQTLLREALLVASHNSYHLGQLVFLKKILSSSS